MTSFTLDPLHSEISWVRVHDPETVAHVYKALWTVEDIIRTAKSILETRPIYHKRDETIRGHVFCSFFVLVLKQELESRMKQAELEWEWKEVIRGLDALQQVEANFQGRRFLFRSQLTGEPVAMRSPFQDLIMIYVLYRRLIVVRSSSAILRP